MAVKLLSESGALIVGGSSGVGLESAVELARAGVSRIGLIARTADRLQAAADRVAATCPGVDVHALSADAVDVCAVRDAVRQAERRLGGVDVLVNSVAGIFAPALRRDIDPESIESTLRGQLLAPLISTRLVLPGMYERGGGSIINIASHAAKVATPGETVLGAAMAGIVTFTQAMALEVKRYGVRSNAITPSLIAGTPTTDLSTRDGFSAKLFAAAAKQAHLGVAEPLDIAALVVFLAGPHSRRLTGQAISVNGGISAA